MLMAFCLPTFRMEIDSDEASDEAIDEATDEAIDEAPESAGGSNPGETPGSELQRLNFLRFIGDHAGHVFHCLRSAARELNKTFPNTAARFSDDLRCEARGKGPAHDFLEECINILNADLLDIDVAMGELAVLRGIGLSTQDPGTPSSKPVMLRLS
jgi:hypothetical protein